MSDMFLTRRGLIKTALGAAVLAPSAGLSGLARAQAGTRLRIGMAATNMRQLAAAATSTSPEEAGGEGAEPRDSNLVRHAPEPPHFPA